MSEVRRIKMIINLNKKLIKRTTTSPAWINHKR